MSHRDTPFAHSLVGVRLYIDARLRLAFGLWRGFLSINLALQILDGVALNLNLVVHLFTELNF